MKFYYRYKLKDIPYFDSIPSLETLKRRDV